MAQTSKYKNICWHSLMKFLWRLLSWWKQLFMNRNTYMSLKPLWSFFSQLCDKSHLKDFTQIWTSLSWRGLPKRLLYLRGCTSINGIFLSSSVQSSLPYFSKWVYFHSNLIKFAKILVSLKCTYKKIVELLHEMIQVFLFQLQYNFINTIHSHI